MAVSFIAGAAIPLTAFVMSQRQNRQLCDRLMARSLAEYQRTAESAGKKGRPPEERPGRELRDMNVVGPAVS